MGIDENIHEPKIQIDGKNSEEFTIGLFVFASQVELHDLIIVNFSSNGISLHGTHHVLISGCYVGVGPGGKDRESNYVGVHIFGGGYENMIDGLPGHPNIIGGNENVGTFIQDTPHHNIIHGNLMAWVKTSWA
ncbi:MAG: hypothetical protein IPL46_01655 [Saprospiraceae bacterium]|nr:hypothetical protein [Saprospiraceae bacterium]